MGKSKISWALIFSIVCIHFMFARPAGFPLTIAPFAILFFLYVHTKKTITMKGLLIGLFLFVWPFCVYGQYEFLGGNTDLAEFGKTYLLWLYASAAVIFGLFSPLSKFRDYSREFIIALIVIAFFSLFQVLLVKIFGSTMLYNPFGEHTYMVEYKVERMVGENFARAPGLFLEPSFNAFIMFFLAVAILLTKQISKSSFWVLVFTLFSVLISGSASGMLATVSLAFFLFLAVVVKNRISRILLLLMAPIILAGVGSFYLSNRVAELSIEGTSGYWRLIAPLVVLGDVFVDFPLGVSFGQIESFLLPFGLQHGEGIGTSIDNGIYYLAFYFGWVWALLVLGLLYKFVQSMLHADTVGVIFWWYILASLQFSGGILLPEYIFPLLLVLYQYRRVRKIQNAHLFVTRQ